MKEVFKSISTNGRSGLSVVAESDVAFPAKGVLTFLGTFEGIKTYKFTADESGKWVFVGVDTF